MTLPGALNAQSGFTYITNNGTITITRYVGSDSIVTVPSTMHGLPVTAIGNSAFERSMSLANVTMPDTVQSLGFGAFHECTNLKAVHLSANLKNIDGLTFARCRRLQDVTLPDAITNIARSAFIECSGLTNVTFPKNLATIMIGAFSGCSNLTVLTLPKRVRFVADYSFGWCSRLAAVRFEGNAPATLPNVFFGANNVTAYYLPGTTGWESTFDGRPTAPWHLPEPVILDFGASFGVRTNRFGFVVSWATNANVAVEACTNLRNDEWSPLATNNVVNGWTYFNDAGWANHPSRIYRVRSL